MRLAKVINLPAGKIQQKNGALIFVSGF